jgi:hypothetical protein
MDLTKTENRILLAKKWFEYKDKVQLDEKILAEIAPIEEDYTNMFITSAEASNRIIDILQKHYFDGMFDEKNKNVEIKYKVSKSLSMVLGDIIIQNKETIFANPDDFNIFVDARIKGHLHAKNPDVPSLPFSKTNFVDMDEDLLSVLPDTLYFEFVEKDWVTKSK